MLDVRRPRILLHYTYSQPCHSLCAQRLLVIFDDISERHDNVSLLEIISTAEENVVFSYHAPVFKRLGCWSGLQPGICCTTHQIIKARWKFSDWCCVSYDFRGFIWNVFHGVIFIKLGTISWCDSRFFSSIQSH